MQKKLFVLGLSMCALQAFARDGFYVAPSVGAGISNVKQDLFKLDPNGGLKTSAIFNYNAQLGIGYRYGRWRLETGLQYTLTGYKYKDLVIVNNYPNTANGESETRYGHLSIPLTVAYTIPLGSRWSFSPQAGALLSFNTGTRYSADFPGVLKIDSTWTSDKFKKERQATSVWGRVALQAGYKAGERVTLFAGPSMQYMFSNFMKTPANAPYKASERSYFINMDLGARISL
ncbi:outer membrane beta-barrel protein [Taibaiella chishuiensis]|uniref:Outer membrane protein with beta-barrel domain n=1 Tax=Taibaiella chishuiensis TaxID=1434707 RepID=A0A2P8DAS5_9BACT|nr:outer membrane beta-barrel protein [Taibaiella chishuiensis]PSK94309.1 outer membrane protein with beta-barrel domain [Taibaiella chishuiensis]